MAASVGKGAKNKGANAEREVAKLFQPILNEEYAKIDKEAPEMKRNLEQTRGGGYDLVGLDWLALEVKRQENLSIPAWWRQTLKQSSEGQTPVLIYRQNNKPWKVIMMGGLRVDKGKWISTRVEVSIDEFKVFLRRKIRYDLCGH